MSDAQGTPVETPPGDLPRLPASTQKGIDAIQKLMGKTPMDLIPECPNTRWSTNLVEEFRSLVNAVKKQRNPKPYSFDEIKSFLLEKAQEHDIKRRTSLEASDVRAAKYHFFGSGKGAGEDNGDRDDAVPGLRNRRPTCEPSAETISQSTCKRVKTYNQDRETPYNTPTTPFATHTSPSTGHSPQHSITVDPQLHISAFGASTAYGVRTNPATIDSRKLIVASHVLPSSLTQTRDYEQPPEDAINDHTPPTTSLPSSYESGFRTDFNIIVRRCENLIGFLIAKASREQALRVEQRRQDLNHARDTHKQRQEEVIKLDKTSAKAKDNLVQAIKRLETAEALFAALENAVGTLDALPGTYLAQVRQSRDKAIADRNLESQRHDIEVKKLEEVKRKRDETANELVGLRAKLETQGIGRL